MYRGDPCRTLGGIEPATKGVSFDASWQNTIQRRTLLKPFAEMLRLAKPPAVSLHCTPTDMALAQGNTHRNKDGNTIHQAVDACQHLVFRKAMNVVLQRVRDKRVPHPHLQQQQCVGRSGARLCVCESTDPGLALVLAPALCINQVVE